MYIFVGILLGVFAGMLVDKFLLCLFFGALLGVAAQVVCTGNGRENKVFDFDLFKGKPQKQTKVQKKPKE